MFCWSGKETLRLLTLKTVDRIGIAGGFSSNPRPGYTGQGEGE